MTTERVHLPVRRPLLEILQQNEIVIGLASLFRSITHQPERDVDIAWEDGEVEEQPDSRR